MKASNAHQNKMLSVLLAIRNWIATMPERNAERKDIDHREQRQMVKMKHYTLFNMYTCCTVQIIASSVPSSI